MGRTTVPYAVDLRRALKRKRAEPEAVEMLDARALCDRIGEPLPPKSAPAPSRYVRADGQPRDRERSWRRTAGLGD